MELARCGTADPFREMKSMHRVHPMIGEVLRLLVQGEPERGMAQCEQNMKAVHQFSGDGTWKTA